MSRICYTTCDRCSKQTERPSSENWQALVVITSANADKANWDLCPDCFKAFLVFCTTKENT